MNLPVLATVWCRKVTPGTRGELLAQVCSIRIVELLLVEAVGLEAELQHRNARALYCTTIGGWMPAAGGRDCIRPRDDLRDPRPRLTSGLNRSFDRDAR